VLRCAAGRRFGGFVCPPSHPLRRSVGLRSSKSKSGAFDVFVGSGSGLTVGGRPSYVPVFRCAPHWTSYGGRRPSSGRPPRALSVCAGVASAPCAGVVVRQVKIKSASGGPAQRASGGVGPAGVGAWWGFIRGGCRRSGRSPRLAPEATREPAGGATGGGFALLLNLTFAGCTPGRTPGRAAPARRGERPDLSRRTVRCAGARRRPPGSRCGIQHPEIPSGSGGVPAAVLAAEFHIDRMPNAGTQLINERRVRPVPGSDVSSGNLGDHRFVDQVGGAGSPGVRCEIQQRPGTCWGHGEISHRDRRAMRDLTAERSAHRRGRGWGSFLGRAGVALSGAQPANVKSRIRPIKPPPVAPPAGS